MTNVENKTEASSPKKARPAAKAPAAKSSPHSSSEVPSGKAKAGFVGGMFVRLLLLFIVLSEITFLAGRYRARVDLTSDRLYTLTDSTETVLGKLDDLLLVEAYFSPKQNLPILEQPLRTALVNLLEEYEQIGGEKVKVRFIDPLENKTTRETAERLGMQPQQRQLSTSGGVMATETWQGFRIRYGAQKQEIIPYMPFPRRQHPTGFYERILTPLIKRLTIVERPKIGVLSFRSRPGGPGMVISMEKKTPPQGFNVLKQEFSRFYDIREIDIRKGQLIPEDIGIAMLIRPKYLSDRTKFIFDQFLMRGGKLIVFADTCEVEIRKDRAFRGTVVPYDAPSAKLRFRDMLKHYGVDTRNFIVAEGVQGLQQLFFDIRQDQQSGQKFQNPLPYPFIFEAANDDWKSRVELMARRADGSIDEAMASQYKEQVKPGMEVDHDLIRAVASLGAPGMFWPCPVELMPELPDGVTGGELLRSSPFSWVEPPNTELDPFDEAVQWQQRDQNIRRWASSKRLMIPPRPKQHSLMVHLEGTFPSFFADKPVPEKPADAAKKKEDKKKTDVEDWGADPEKKDEKPAELPEPAAEEAEEDPETIEVIKVAQPGAKLIVIGDATFVRDDFLTGMYAQPDATHLIELIGPVDRGIQAQRAFRFIKNLLDWLAQERDLLALENKVPTDRTMKFLEPDQAAQETPDEFRERLTSFSFWLKLGNAIGPALLLFLFGLLVYFVRRAKKKAFLATL